MSDLLTEPYVEGDRIRFTFSGREIELRLTDELAALANAVRRDVLAALASAVEERRKAA